jgi:Zn-dependent peptidase ImmA (M78 family)/transcriptional regulator with XRE-family HTH domain
MLRLARQRRQLSQIDAAALLGVDQSLLSRIENGVAEARDELLLRAQESYDLPRSFFFLTDPVYGAPVSVHPMWRKKADVTGREMDGVVAELNIRSMHLRRLLEGAEFVAGSNVPRMDIEDFGDPSKIAGLVRAHWKVPSGPIKNLTALVERAGVLVVHSPLSGASISGVTFSPPGMPSMIVLNSAQPADRLRFTLAHELGHLVMHRFPSAKMEEEANAFASDLLMPASDIAPYFVGRRVDLSLLAGLKPEWRVAMSALLMRATSLSAVSKHQAQYLWKQMSARGLRLREPPELDFEPERPSVVTSMLELHRNTLGYTDPELAAFLHVRESGLRETYGIAAEAKRARIAIVR